MFLLLFFRYLNLYPEDTEHVQKWEEALKNYIAVAPQHSPLRTLDLFEIQPSQFMSREDQFKVISLLSNNPFLPYPKYDGTMSSIDSYPSFFQHLLYPLGDSVDIDDPKPNLYPTSLRNRLLYFAIHNNLQYVRLICNHIVRQIFSEAVIDDQSSDLDLSAIEETSNGVMPAKRRCCPRVVKDAPQMTDTLAKNLALERSLYVNFREQLLTSGHISIRSFFQNGGVILMNDYNDENGYFLPSSYAHVAYFIVNDVVLFDCSCSSSIISQQCREISEMQISSSCMHCRFANEYLLNVCKKPASIQDMTGSTNLEKKLLENHSRMNVGVVVLSDSPSSAVKMSVRGQDGLCSFVHLSVCRKYVSCQQGSCQASMRNKKKTITLLNLESHNKICQHLQTLHCNRETWSSLVPPVEELQQTLDLPSEPRNADDHNINVKVIFRILLRQHIIPFHFSYGNVAIISGYLVLFVLDICRFWSNCFFTAQPLRAVGVFFHPWCPGGQRPIVCPGCISNRKVLEFHTWQGHFLGV